MKTRNTRGIFEVNSILKFCHRSALVGVPRHTYICCQATDSITGGFDWLLNDNSKCLLWLDSSRPWSKCGISFVIVNGLQAIDIITRFLRCIVKALWMMERLGSEYKHSNVHNEGRSGQPSGINEDLVKKVDKKVKENRGSFHYS